MVVYKNLVPIPRGNTPARGKWISHKQHWESSNCPLVNLFDIVDVWMNNCDIR